MPHFQGKQHLRKAAQLENRMSEDTDGYCALEERASRQKSTMGNLRLEIDKLREEVDYCKANHAGPIKREYCSVCRSPVIDSLRNHEKVIVVVVCETVL